MSIDSEKEQEKWQGKYLGEDSLSRAMRIRREMPCRAVVFIGLLQFSADLVEDGDGGA